MPSEPLEGARSRFTEWGLELPPVPVELQARFHQIGDEVFGTRDDAVGLSGTGWYMEEVLTTDVGDYVLMGEGGYGAASRALHYYLVHRPLALFVQLSWGHAYADRDRERSHAASVLAAAARLVAVVDENRRAGRLGQDHRLVVVQSDLGDSYVVRLDGLLSREDLFEADWDTVDDAIGSALSALS